MTDRNDAIAILGGTGDQGLGLALRFAKAGRPVVIGSRKVDRAETARDEVKQAVPDADVSGFGNEEAAKRAGIVIISVPFEHTASTVKGVAQSLSQGQILVSMAVPLATAVGDGAVRTLGIWQGSAAEMVKSLAPKGVEVVSAFQNVSAHRLQDLGSDVDCDIVVSGPKAARSSVIDLCGLIPGLRGINGGPLSNAKIVEEMTALMIGINIRYKLPEGVGVRFTGLPDA